MKRDPVVSVIGKLPFSGRYSIRAAFVGGKEGAQSGNFAKKAMGISYLGFMVLVHAGQCKIGITTADAHLHEGILSRDAMATYDTAYALANVSVSYTQARLLGIVATTKRQHNRSHAAAQESLHDPEYEHTDEERSEYCQNEFFNDAQQERRQYFPGINDPEYELTDEERQTALLTDFQPNFSPIDSHRQSTARRLGRMAFDTGFTLGAQVAFLMSYVDAEYH